MAREILPESVVMRTPEATAWWVPAAVRPMFFSKTSDGKTLNGQSYPHPPLVFVVDGGHGLSVRAVMEESRPGPQSAIAVAPYWNVNQAAEICLGSMATPRSAGLASLAEWVEGFRSEKAGRGRRVPLRLRRTGTSTRPQKSVLVPWPRRARPGWPAWRSGSRASSKANSRMLEASRSPATPKVISGSGVTWLDNKCSRRNG